MMNQIFRYINYIARVEQINLAVHKIASLSCREIVKLVKAVNVSAGHAAGNIIGQFFVIVVFIFVSICMLHTLTPILLYQSAAIKSRFCVIILFFLDKFVAACACEII